MSLVKTILVKTILAIFLIFASISQPILANETFVPTHRDTLPESEVMEIVPFDTSEFEFVHQAGDFRFYFRDDRDIFAVLDTRNGYTWTTGLNLEFNVNLEEQCRLAEPENRIDECLPLEYRLNSTFIAMANSLITIEYFDNALSLQRISSASFDNASSTLIEGDGVGHFILDVNFSQPSLRILVNIFLDENGIHYEIFDEDIIGEGQEQLAAILITPFLGASGGIQRYFNEETQNHDIFVPREAIPGYVLVPDGSGALIRFRDNTTTIMPYTGSVFGLDPAQYQFHTRTESGIVPLMNPILPVFGIAHGYMQNAFVAFADSGAEFMEIIVVPRENMTEYTWAYPRFRINQVYHQVYNQQGSGYFTIRPERNRFDISISYHFLQGDGSTGRPSASYFGMALAYQASLVEQGVLSPREVTAGDIPIRIDFLMSDMRNSILGRQNVVVTTTDNVRTMVQELQVMGVVNINSGLLGWQRGGLTFRNPGNADFIRQIGRRNTFRTLINDMNELGVDLSFSEDYVTFSHNSVSEFNTSARHINGWFMRHNILGSHLPATSFAYARPETSVNWLHTQVGRLSPLGIQSHTIDGMSNTLITNVAGGNDSLTETREMFTEAFAAVNEDLKINAVTPNSFLWENVDRFLQAPVFSSQHLIQTDTVPFLQVVLSGMMEVYAPYSNFSFASDIDVLRMIDYNIYPSFVLTYLAPHYLSTTNSANFFSTEFTSYKDVIASIYTRVNDALSYVRGVAWTSRTVIAPGVVVNTYANGTKIIINYTNSPVQVGSVTVEPISARIVQ